ncbi:4'-phosphopantetheinyl transferase family protein [Ventosimonas gracilis]|uniref:4'-phosphopantetheinyl transferase family protein n=1 Tax=Ventosimonas gracilis TaxID=1680762 RepID=UPI0009A17DB6|nr:4'-phosphopantetheinyl transferase superfamily protein [Ventosimonas gracilis]
MAEFHPAFCQPFERYPPLLQACACYGLRFNPALFEQTDFTRCDIAPVTGNAKRQSEYLAGRLCARQGLFEVIGEYQAPPRSSGGMPLWPHGARGSISHSHGRAAAVVGPASRWRALGLDLEPCLPVARALRLAPSILTPSERAHLAALTSAKEQAFFVTLSFSLKESLFKALYPLCLTRFYFQHAQIVDYRQGKATVRLLCDLPGFAAQSLLSGQFLRQDQFVLTLVAIAAEPA